MDLIETSQNINRHPWELSRTKCIIGQLKKYKIHGKILDIGCGDAYFDRELLQANNNIEICGVDINLKQEYEEERLHIYNDLSHVPEDKFDYILMMDVLEHIEDDAGYLTSIKEKLKDSGTILITVPAFQSLYSLHDEELKHFRRYNHKSLVEIIAKSGLHEISWSYFYLSLIIGRLLTKNKTENLSCWQKSADNFLTKFVTFVLNADFSVLRFLSYINIHLPGLSLMSICKKK